MAKGFMLQLSRAELLCLYEIVEDIADKSTDTEWNKKRLFPLADRLSVMLRKKKRWGDEG